MLQVSSSPDKGGLERVNEYTLNGGKTYLFWGVLPKSPTIWIWCLVCRDAGAVKISQEEPGHQADSSNSLRDVLFRQIAKFVKK